MKEEIAKFKQYLARRYPESSTTKHYMSDLGIFSQFVGEKSAQEITSKTIDAFVQAQNEQQLKPKTINRRLATLSSFFEFLISETEADQWRNPVHWKRHSIRAGQRLPRDVSDETVERLFRVIDDERDRGLLTLMVKAGLRVGETVALNRGDLDRAGPDGLTRLKVRGKGNKERMVWLTLETRQQVEQWLHLRPESDSQALFLNQHGRRLSVAGVQYRLKQYGQRAGVRVSCHQLRHTFGRRLAEQKMPLDSLAKLMGHNDLHTTQGYIDGADPVVRADFLAALGQLDQLALPREAGLTQFPAVVAEPRPDHAAILEKLSQRGADLPPWLWSHLYQHTLRQMPHWTPAHLEKRARFHLGTLCRICRWLVKERDWAVLDQLRRADVVAYLNHRQEAGLKASSIAMELGLFRSFWRDLLAQEVVLNGAILQVKSPPQAEPLPKYLTSAEFQKLEQVIRTETAPQRHRDWFNRAWFYLLAHGGLRISEALNLRLSDCDFSHRRLRIRAGKGNRDRVIPMTPKLVTVIQEYLAVRESAKTDHLLLFQSRPVDVKLVHRRLKVFGQQAGIEGLSPHRMRHTLATLLINGGMPITSLQKFLGHQDVNQTLIYGRVYDETVRRQFATAMAQIETILVSHWPTPEEASVENSPLSLASSSG